MAGIYIHNFTKERYEELLMWARVGANNCMIGENTGITVVPDHGDLIDREKLKSKAFYYNEDDCFTVVSARDVRNAPTIIPASWKGAVEDGPCEEGEEPFIPF